MFLNRVVRINLHKNRTNLRINFQKRQSNQVYFSKERKRDGIGVSNSISFLVTGCAK